MNHPKWIQGDEDLPLKNALEKYHVVALIRSAFEDDDIF